MTTTITSHVIELRDDSWTIMHPMSCRPNLFDCPLSKTAGQSADELQASNLRGRFMCWLENTGQLVIGSPVTEENPLPLNPMGDLTWLVAHGYEVSIEAGENRTGLVSGADIAVRMDRHYWDEALAASPTTPEIEYARERTFWGGEHGIEGALHAARLWAEEHDDE